MLYELKRQPALGLPCPNSIQMLGMEQRLLSNLVYTLYLCCTVLYIGDNAFPPSRSIYSQRTWRTGWTPTRRGWGSTRSRPPSLCTTPSCRGCGSTTRCRQEARGRILSRTSHSGLICCKIILNQNPDNLLIPGSTPTSSRPRLSSRHRTGDPTPPSLTVCC